MCIPAMPLLARDTYIARPGGGLIPPAHRDVLARMPKDANGRIKNAAAATDGNPISGGISDNDSMETVLQSDPYRMCECAPLTVLLRARKERGGVQRLVDARRGLCYLPIAPRSLDVEDDGVGRHSTLERLHSALGFQLDGTSPPDGYSDGREPASVVASALSLPPLSVLMERSLVRPVRERCAAAGPLLLAAVSEHASPSDAASLLHRVMLFAEPRLTAPLFEGLFARLAEHYTWRRQLPALQADLIDCLVATNVPLATARSFTFDLGGAVTSGVDSAATLDAVDVRALSELRLRFRARWPVQLAVSDGSLATHEEIFQLLLQLRRAKWALETAERDHGHRSFDHGTDNRYCAHPWWVLRAEVLHIVSTIYSHFTLGVIGPEWRIFQDALPMVGHVDAFRAAHEAFILRVHRRCLLAPRDEPILLAIERILSIALRLRVQLNALPRLPAQAHAASAARWRSELHTGVRFVLDELRAAAEREPRAELDGLCQLFDFNGFYSSSD